jgi:tripartite-type tricarboxylate transporter receptor subunit TctC
MASAGGGGLPHLAIELLKNESGGRFVHVPYKGATPAVVDTAGGHVNGVIMDLPVLIPMIKDGRLRGLAVADVQRAELTPDLPTTKEVGLPGVLAFNWFALMAPVKTPAPIVERLHAAVVEAANSPDVKKKLIDVGIAPLTQPTVKAANDFMQSETEKWGKVAKGAGVTAN